MRYYNFGWCSCCGTNLLASWFIEEEYKRGYKTGRVRQATKYLYCPNCGRIKCVDDSFDGEWHYE